MKTKYSMLKRQLVIASIGISGAIAGSGAFAGPQGATPSAADETTPSMSTLLSLDHTTGGYKGWGPMANMGSSAAEVAEVKRSGDAAWAAEAALREPYQLRSLPALRAAARDDTVTFTVRADGTSLVQ